MLDHVHSNVLIFLLCSVGLIVLPHAWNLSNLIIGFFYILWLWRLLGVYRKTVLPNRLILFLATLAGIALLYSQHQGLLGLDAGTHIIITALGLKLLEIRSERDLYLVVYLAFVVAATLFLYQQSIGLAIYIVFVCVSLLATLIILNGRVTATIALKIAGLLLLQALPVATILFLLFPRIEAPRWEFLQDKHKAKTGLSEIFEPGSISDLGLSDELVFRAKFTGAVPPPAHRYWRGPVYTYTNGKLWLPSTQKVKVLPQDYLSVSGAAYQYTVLMEPQDKEWVFALELPVGIRPPLRLTGDYQLMNDGNTHIRNEYVLRSYPTFNTGTLDNAEFKENTQLPAKVSPKITELVTRLQGVETSPEALIRQILTHFRTEAFYYTLRPPLMEQDPIETFLLKTRAGFCGHYATAFVYLMRVAGFPARVVSGYQGGEYNKVGNFLEIRQADAHAWAEVWLSDKGWTRVDPTAAIAPERIEQGVNIDLQIASGLVNFSRINLGQSGMVNFYQQFRQVWQSVDYQWQRWVINYTNEQQADLLAALGMFDIQTMLRALFILITLLTLGLFIWLTRQPRQTKDAALIWYEKFCAKLAKLGLIKAPAETATAFADRVSKRYPTLNVAVHQITVLFLKIRYGKDIDPNELKLLAQRVKTLNINQLLKKHSL